MPAKSQFWCAGCPANREPSSAVGLFVGLNEDLPASQVGRLAGQTCDLNPRIYRFIIVFLSAPPRDDGPRCVIAFTRKGSRGLGWGARSFACESGSTRPGEAGKRSRSEVERKDVNRDVRCGPTADREPRRPRFCRGSLMCPGRSMSGQEIHWLGPESWLRFSRVGTREWSRAWFSRATSICRESCAGRARRGCGVRLRCCVCER